MGVQVEFGHLESFGVGGEVKGWVLPKCDYWLRGRKKVRLLVAYLLLLSLLAAVWHPLL